MLHLFSIAIVVATRLLYIYWLEETREILIDTLHAGEKEQAFELQLYLTHVIRSPANLYI